MGATPFTRRLFFLPKNKETHAMTIRKLHLNKREVRKLDHRASKVEPTATAPPVVPAPKAKKAKKKK